MPPVPLAGVGPRDRAPLHPRLSSTQSLACVHSVLFFGFLVTHQAPQLSYMKAPRKTTFHVLQNLSTWLSSRLLRTGTELSGVFVSHSHPTRPQTSSPPALRALLSPYCTSGSHSTQAHIGPCVPHKHLMRQTGTLAKEETKAQGACGLSGVTLQGRYSSGLPRAYATTTSHRRTGAQEGSPLLPLVPPKSCPPIHT